MRILEHTVTPAEDGQRVKHLLRSRWQLLDAAGRRKLLRMIDTQNSLLAESTLMSFTAGKSGWPLCRRWC